MTYRLIPKPWGFYAISPDGPCAPDIENDLDYLMDGDAHEPSGPWSLRADVLIERIEDVEVTS